MNGPVVVVGDTLLDRDVDGLVDRLCPDAPAPVLEERASADRPGGAGLAALLAAQNVGEVALVTALADDVAGARLSQAFYAAGVQLYPLPLPGVTPEKIRLRSRGQVLLRLDRGGAGLPPGEPGAEVLELLAAAGAILVSDYGRGVAASPALRAALAATSAPVVWDPHPRGPAAVPGVRLVTPNEAEVRELAGEVRGDSRLLSAARGAQGLRQRWQVGAVAVTLGCEGALLCHAGETPLVVPTPTKADGDTCGAGDQFAAAAVSALSQGALVSEAVQEAVTRAAEYVIRGGVSSALRASGGGVASGGEPADRVDIAGRAAIGRGERGGSIPSEAGPKRRSGVEIAAVGAQAVGALVTRVRAGGGTVVATGGCFDLLHAGHVATLHAARRLGDCLVVCLNSDASVTGLKGPGRPLVPQADRCRLLAALGCVDAVLIFDEPTPHAILSWLRPDVWVKGGDYGTGGGDEPDLPEAGILRRWNGHTVVVPYLDGRSTTRMIAAARAARKFPTAEGA